MGEHVIDIVPVYRDGVRALTEIHYQVIAHSTAFEEVDSWEIWGNHVVISTLSPEKVFWLKSLLSCGSQIDLEPGIAIRIDLILEVDCGYRTSGSECKTERVGVVDRVPVEQVLACGFGQRARMPHGLAEDHHVIHVGASIIHLRQRNERIIETTLAYCPRIDNVCDIAGVGSCKALTAFEDHMRCHSTHRENVHDSVLELLAHPIAMRGTRSTIISGTCHVSMHEV